MGQGLRDDTGFQHLVQGQRLAEYRLRIELCVLACLDRDHGEGFPAGPVARHVFPCRRRELSEGAVQVRQGRQGVLHAQQQDALGLPRFDGLAGLMQQAAAVRRQVPQRYRSEPGELESTLQGPCFHQA